MAGRRTFRILASSHFVYVFRDFFKIIMCINFVGFIFFIYHRFFPLFTSLTTFVSVIYLFFSISFFFLSTCPLHVLFFYPFF
jgi:hypothetical protein